MSIRESLGLFGAQNSPEWVEWNNTRNAIVAQHQDAGTGWNEYVEAMGGVQSAYGALQDRLKGEFLGRFARTYAAIHGEPLRLGTRSIVSAERHVGFVDPAERERLRKEEAKLVDTLRARVQGKYSYGSVKDKLDRLLQEQEIARQNQ